MREERGGERGGRGVRWHQSVHRPCPFLSMTAKPPAIVQKLMSFCRVARGRSILFWALAEETVLGGFSREDGGRNRGTGRSGGTTYWPMDWCVDDAVARRCDEVLPCWSLGRRVGGVLQTNLGVGGSFRSPFINKYYRHVYLSWND